MVLNLNKLMLVLVFFLFVYEKQETRGQVIEQDYLALIALYDSTSGSNWSNNNNWLTNEPVSDWYGVTVSNNRVIKIDLSVNNLVGTIPPNFEDLTNLTELNLERNELSGTFPEEILALTNLTSLKLRNNSFSGSIPNNIDALINLEHLGLENNPLSGHLPSELGNISNLKDLRIGGTFQIDGLIPPELGNLINLTYLDLRQNKLEGNIPPELGKLINLEYLALYWNKLTGEIPPELGKLVNIRYGFFLNNNQITGPIPVELGNLTQVINFQLKNNKLSGAIPAELSNLINASILILSGNQLSGHVPSEFSNLSSLQKFHIDHNQLTRLPDLSSLTALTELFIEDNNFTFRDVEPNVGIAADYTYSPQDSLGIEIDTTIDVGASIVFSVSAGGDNSIYKWIKDDVVIDGAVDSIYMIGSAITDNSGTYICEVNNTIASELTLYSMPFKLTVGSLVDVDKKSVKLPEVFVLSQNYPNPFNPITKISYSIPNQSHVSLKVFDTLGREVASLVNHEQTVGNYKVELIASNLTSGIYFYRIQAGDFSETKKMVLTK